MPQFNIPYVERIFVAPQSNVALVPNSSGTWTNTGAKLLRSGTNGCKIKALTPLTSVPWKTGTRSIQPGIFGRRNATFALNNLPVIASGSAGVAPDMDLLLQGIFGAAPTVNVGTSVVYAFADTTWQPFILARFAHNLATVTQQFCYGCTPEQATWTLNGNVFEMNASGTAFWSLDSENFSNEDTTGKGGLTSFPLEVSSPTVVGAIQPGFQGVATFDGNGMDPTTAPVIGCSISIKTGNILYMDNFGSTYPSTQGGAQRMVELSVTFQDSDSSALNNLKTKAKAKTPLNVTLQVGVNAGNIHTFVIKAIQLNVAEYSDDNARVIANFGTSPAHASAIANVDDLTYTLT